MARVESGTRVAAARVAASTRVAVSRQDYFHGTALRPRLSNAARIVTNAMSPTYRTYNMASWGEFPANDPDSLIAWGGDVDGSQSFTITTNGVTLRVWASFNHTIFAVGETYILSFEVESTDGTMVNDNVAVTGVAVSGTSTVNAPAVGRHAIRFTTTATGTMTVRVGIGASGNGPANASIKCKNIMLERVYDDRTYPYEYVNASDSRAFDHTYSVAMSGTLLTTETVGSSVAVEPGCSVLVVGDSMTNDIYTSGSQRGDFPYQMRNYIGTKSAISTYGVSGETIAQTETQLTSAMSDNFADSRAVPWKVVILQGGTNDVNSGRTFAQMQADQLSRIALVESYGMIPVCVTVPPLDAATAGQQAVMDSYNSWLISYCTDNGIACYDVNAHANDGSDNFKTSWGSADGIHPGTGYNQGATFMAQKLADLVCLL